MEKQPSSVFDEAFEAAPAPRGSAEPSAWTAGTSARSRQRNLGECARVQESLSLAPRVACAY